MANTAFTHDPTITVPSSTVNNRVVTWNGTTGKVFNNTALVTIDAGAVAGVTTLAASTSITTPSVLLSGSSNILTLDVAAVTAAYTIIFPDAVPGAAGKVLQSSGSSPYSTLEWGTPATSTSHQVLRKTLDESVTSSTTLQNDDDFTFSIGANEVWVVQLYLFTTGVDTGGLKHDWLFSAGGSYAFGNITWIQHNAGGAISSSSGKETSVGVVQDASSSTVVKGAIVTALLKNGSSAGTVTWRWAQHVSNGTATTIQADSAMIAHKV